jgi:hypothetical protein
MKIKFDAYGIIGAIVGFAVTFLYGFLIGIIALAVTGLLIYLISRGDQKGERAQGFFALGFPAAFIAYILLKVLYAAALL